jgi:hypothetical protein
MPDLTAPRPPASERPTLAEAQAMLELDQLPPPTSFTLQHLVNEARRELELRRRCYPRWVADGRISAAAAVQGLAKQHAVHRLLESQLQAEASNRGSGTLL